MKRLLLALLAICLPLGAQVIAATPSVVQVVNGASITIQNAGDTLIVEYLGQAGSSGAFTSIASSPSLSYTTDVPFFLMHDGTNGVYYPVGVWSATGTAATTYTVTVTATGVTSPRQFLIECSGCGAFDAAQSTSTSYGLSTSAASGSLTPAASNDLLLAETTVIASGITFSGLGSFTSQDVVNSSSPSAISASYVDSATSSISFAATLSASDKWGSYLVAFEAAGSGTCSHPEITQAGAIAIPNGSSGSYRLCNGSFGTPNCTSMSYRQTAGACGVN